MRAASVMIAVLASACTHAPAQERRPALVVQPDARSRAELQDVIGAALNQRPLLLADDALTRDSVLILERAPRRDAAGNRMDGRESGLPERFRLFVEGSRCLLQHERTGQWWYLRHTVCSPATGPARQ